MIYFNGKNSCLNRMVLHFYAFIANAIYYEQMHPVFVVQEGISYLRILLYTNFAKIYLLATKSLLQVKEQASVYLKLHCCH